MTRRLLAALLLITAGLFGSLSDVPSAYAQSTFCNTALHSATTGEAVTPSDSTVFTPPARALYVGGAGNVKVRMTGNGGSTSLVFTGVPAGSILPLCVDMVYATDTTATTIVLLR